MRAPADFNIAPAGDAAFLLRFGAGIDRALSRRVLAALAALDAAHLPGVIDLLPAYASLLVIFDPLHTDGARITTAITATLANVVEGNDTPGRHITIPVLYRADVAPDLAPLAAAKGMSVDELVARHSAPRYHCHMLGFRPGFPFLGGLDARLHTPRLATPRTDVPAGAVAIAGQQTGVYPQAGPGGWNIIGRTPLRLFDPRRADPFLIAPGDAVSFVPIDEAAFAQAARA